MPTPTKGPRLGGSPAHQRLILANLASQLFEHRKITTTEAKAKRVRPLAERLITKAKRGDLHARRQVMRTIRDRSVVHELFTDIAPIFAHRDGGYLRITKIGPRKGDNAPMAVIELVTEPVGETSTDRPAAKKAAATAPAETATSASEPTNPAVPEATQTSVEGTGDTAPAADQSGTDEQNQGTTES